MSQLIGQTFKTRIPEFADDASIEEAFKVYHYGVDNYTVESIPDDSIEGNFRNLNSRVTTVESTIAGYPATFLTRTSSSSSPNVIIGQNTTTVPITVRAIASQTVPLQQWQNSSNTNIAVLTTAGAMALASYLSLGSITTSSTTALSISIISNTHRGITIRSAASQSANIQEWQDSSGTPLAWINSAGDFYAERIDCGSP